MTFLLLKDWKRCEAKLKEGYPSCPLTTVRDSPAPNECKDRAKRSLPPGLIVKESGIPGAGLGVWAERFFPEGVRFGPYRGEIFEYDKEDADKSEYSSLVRISQCNTWSLVLLNVLHFGRFSRINFGTTSLPVKMTIVNTAETRYIVSSTYRILTIPSY